MADSLSQIFATKRIQKDLKSLQKTKTSACIIRLSSTGPIRGDLFHWRGVLLGPKNSPYEGGLFVLDIRFCHDYPYKPPQILIKTPIYHPNINKAGQICLDILHDAWVASMDIESVLISIILLLDKPNPKDPLNLKIAKEMIETPNLFLQKAKKWTKTYATPPSPSPLPTTTTNTTIKTTAAK